MQSFNNSFFSFVLGLFGIILASFGLTVILDSYALRQKVDEGMQGALIMQALHDLTTGTE